MRTSHPVTSWRCGASHRPPAAGGPRETGGGALWSWGGSPGGQAHLVGLVADPAAEGLPPDVGHHVPLQHGRSAEDLAARRAGVVLLGVHLVDVLAVVLQGGEAHPALLAVIWVFDVWWVGETPQATVSEKRLAVWSSRCQTARRSHGATDPRAGSHCYLPPNHLPPLSRGGG